MKILYSLWFRFWLWILGGTNWANGFRCREGWCVYSDWLANYHANRNIMPYIRNCLVCHHGKQYK